MDKGTLQKKVAEVGFWYHKIQLPWGVSTPGENPVSAEAYQLPADLKGWRVLDVGAWDGYWTFECLKRGAREVVVPHDRRDRRVAARLRARRAARDEVRRRIGARAVGPHEDDTLLPVGEPVGGLAERGFGRRDVAG